jgi:hypothetical protein
MSWYNNQNQAFIDATQELPNQTSQQIIINEIAEISDVFIPKQINNVNGTTDTIIKNNTANSRIFLQNANTTPKIKIEGGKLYLYYDYSFTNAPTITAGWIDVDNYITAIKQDLILEAGNIVTLDTTIFAPTVGLLPRISQLEILTTTTTAKVISLEVDVTYLMQASARNTIDGGLELSEELADNLTEAIRDFRNNALDASDNLTLLVENSAYNAMGAYTETATNVANALYNSKSALYSAHFANVINTLVGAGVIVSIISSIYDFFTSSAKEKDINKLLILYEKVKNDPQSNIPRFIHLDGLLIISNTNNGFSTFNTYKITLSNLAVLRIKTNGSAGLATIVSVENPGSATFEVLNNIYIPKSQLGGTSGDLQIRVISLISEVKVLTNLINKTNDDIVIIQNRRRLRHGIINTDELGDGLTTEYNSSLTNTETGEVLQVPTIKLNLNSTQLETISGVLNIKKYINSDDLAKIHEILLPSAATITSDYKLNLGYKEIFLNYPYDLIMMAIKSDTYTTFSATNYNNDYLGYFPNMSRLSLTGDAKVINTTTLTANSSQHFTKGLIYIKNTNETKLFNMNRKFEFVSFLKFSSFTNNTTNYHLIQSGNDLGQLDTTKLSVYIKNRKLRIKHPALVSYAVYTTGSLNSITTRLLGAIEYFTLEPITISGVVYNDNIRITSTPMGSGYNDYKYELKMLNVPYRLNNGSDFINTPTGFIRIVNANDTSQPNYDTRFIAMYLNHPSVPTTPIANCIYPTISYVVGIKNNGDVFLDPDWNIQRIILRFDILFHRTQDLNYEGAPEYYPFPVLYQENPQITDFNTDFTFRLRYSVNGVNYITHDFTMNNVTGSAWQNGATSTGTSVRTGWYNNMDVPKRYWTYTYTIPNTYPIYGQKVRFVDFTLVKKPNWNYLFATTAENPYMKQPVLHLYEFKLEEYTTTPSQQVQVIANNYETIDANGSLIGLSNTAWYLLNLQLDLPNNSINYYFNNTLYNFTERNTIDLYPADTTMPDPAVPFVSATFVSWANLTTDNSVLVIGNIPSTGEVQFTHFNYRYFQNTEQFLTLTQVQKLMGLIAYNYYYDYVSVDKLLDTNEIFANQLLTKQLVVNNNKLTNTFTTALRTRDLRTNQTQDEGNVLIPIRNLYVENPTASGNLSYNLTTKTFSISSGGVGTRSEEDDIILGFIEDSAGTGLQWNNTNKTLNVIPESLWQDLTPIYTQITTTSNTLLTDFVARDAILDTKITTTSNILFTDFVARDAVLNTKITTTSNTLLTDFVARDAILNTWITTTSNTLLTDFITRDAVLTTDYIARDDIMVLDSIERDDNLAASIEANKYTDTKVLNLLGSSTSLVFKELTLAKPTSTSLSLITYATGTTNISASTAIAQLGIRTDINMYFTNLQYLTFTIIGVIILQIESAGILANKTLTITGTNQLNFQTGSVSLPATITGGTGAKIIYYPSTTTYPYSTGVASSTLWSSVPTGATHAFYVNGVRCMRTTTNETIISSTAENVNCILGLSTPFDASVNKYGCAIIAEAQNTWNRANLCLCVNNVADPTTSASLTSSVRMRMWYYAWTEFYGTYASPTGLYSFFSGGNTVITYANTFFSNICVKVNGSIWINGGSVAVSSTREIKKEIEELDDQECLNKLLQLKPCKYRYIDNTLNKHPTKKVFGFIAEEVKEVIPEAVDDNLKGVIPNIYENAEVEGDILTILTKTLEIDKIYTCYGKENDDKIIIKVLEDLGDGDYKIDKTYDNKINLFIYGKEIDNYHALKKEYLHALAISAIQEHNKIIMKQKEEIMDLTARLAKLEGIVAGMLNI